MNAAPIALERPSHALLPGYVAALRTGWSPNNTRDVSGEHLDAIAADPAAFLADFDWAPDKMVAGLDGVLRPRLPGATFWISDGTFCGVIGFRHQFGTDELPPDVPGHIGYAVVPWKRRQGIATTALQRMLPMARRAGLLQVLLTADADNVASQRVILAAAGRLIGEFASIGGHKAQLLFAVPVTDQAG